MAEEPTVLRLRRDLLGAGYSDDELARLTRQGELSRLRRGAYVDGALPGGAAERHRLLVQATVAALRRHAVVSHQSAAVLWRMPLWAAPLGRVHITRNPPALQDRSTRLRCHVARLRPDEITEVDGIPVTTPIRTALDLARSLPVEPAVVALDAALRLGLVLPDDLRARLFDISGTPGSRAAARAVGLADGRSESVGESRSRVVLHQQGLAPSSLQHEIHVDGRLVARTDFAWQERRLVGEFDGRIKYGRLLRPGQNPGDAVFEEKRREDRIREADWGVVRWCWDELSTPSALCSRIRRALDRRR